MPAAGSGARFGGAVPKQLIEIGGRQVVEWTVERLLAAGLSGLTVALPGDWIARVPGKLGEDPRVTVVPGGRTRQESVSACLKESHAAEDDLVVVHDGARPALALTDLLATVEAARTSDGAVLGRELSDTLKRTQSGRIVSTVDRELLFRAETPQVFRRSVLEEALGASARDGFEGTDEASLVERLPGRKIIAVMAQAPNPKLTSSRDMPLLQSLLEST